jgi:hypothetical protein
VDDLTVSSLDGAAAKSLPDFTAAASGSSAQVYNPKKTRYKKRMDKQLGLKRWAQNVITCWNAGFGGHIAVKTQFEEIKKSEGRDSTVMCPSGEPLKRRDGGMDIQ